MNHHLCACPPISSYLSFCWHQLMIILFVWIRFWWKYVVVVVTSVESEHERIHFFSAFFYMEQTWERSWETSEKEGGAQLSLQLGWPVARIASSTIKRVGLGENVFVPIYFSWKRDLWEKVEFWMMNISLPFFCFF